MANDANLYSLASALIKFPFIDVSSLSKDPLYLAGIAMETNKVTKDLAVGREPKYDPKYEREMQNFANFIRQYKSSPKIAATIKDPFFAAYIDSVFTIVRTGGRVDFKGFEASLSKYNTQTTQGKFQIEADSTLISRYSDVAYQFSPNTIIQGAKNAIAML